MADSGRDEQVRGGYVLLAKRIQDSPLWEWSPDHLRLWIHLLIHVHHGRTPKMDHGIEINRGELLTSFREIANRCRWVENNREWIWRPGKVKRMLQRMEADGMLSMRLGTPQLGTGLGTGLGTLIRIHNFNRYQNFQSYQQRAWDGAWDGAWNHLGQARDGGLGHPATPAKEPNANNLAERQMEAGDASQAQARDTKNYKEEEVRTTTEDPPLTPPYAVNGVGLPPEVDPVHALLLLANAHNGTWKNSHPLANEVIDWWIQLRGMKRPPEASIGKQGTAAKRIAARYPRKDILRALIGISELYPFRHPKMEPWDLFDLEKKFTKAHDAFERHPEVQTWKLEFELRKQDEAREAIGEKP